MHANIFRVPSGTLPVQGPPLLVVRAEEGIVPADLYRKNANTLTPFRCVAGSPMLALIRTPLLSTPDRVTVVESLWTDSELTVDLEIRNFTGELAGNDPWIALVTLELGVLKQGAHKIIVRTTSLHFTDLRHPETANGPTVTVRNFRFECT